MIARKVLQAERNLAEHLVADIVPVGVVDRFEVIEIEKDHSDWLLDTGEGGQIFLQCVVEIASVMKPRQRIRDCSLLKGFRTNGQRCRHVAQPTAFGHADLDRRVDKEHAAGDAEPGEHHGHVIVFYCCDGFGMNRVKLGCGRPRQKRRDPRESEQEQQDKEKYLGLV